MNRRIEEQLEQEGVYVSTTVGWSMFPMLRNRRDRVVVQAIGDRQLKKYDLPLYHRPDGKYILHRIIRTKDDAYVIRGDNTYCREYVPKTWVIGYVTEYYRNDRHHSTETRGHHAYAALWNFLYPIRFVIYRGIRFAASLYRKLRRALLGKKNQPEQT